MADEQTAAAVATVSSFGVTTTIKSTIPSITKTTTNAFGSSSSSFVTAQGSFNTLPATIVFGSKSSASLPFTFLPTNAPADFHNLREQGWEDADTDFETHANPLDDDGGGGVGDDSEIEQIEARTLEKEEKKMKKLVGIWKEGKRVTLPSERLLKLLPKIPLGERKVPKKKKRVRSRQVSKVQNESTADASSKPPTADPPAKLNVPKKKVVSMKAPRKASTQQSPVQDKEPSKDRPKSPPTDVLEELRVPKKKRKGSGKASRKTSSQQPQRQQQQQQQQQQPQVVSQPQQPQGVSQQQHAPAQGARPSVQEIPDRPTSPSVEAPAEIKVPKKSRKASRKASRKVSKQQQEGSSQQGKAPGAVGQRAPLMAVSTDNLPGTPSMKQQQQQSLAASNTPQAFTPRKLSIKQPHGHPQTLQENVQIPTIIVESSTPPSGSTDKQQSTIVAANALPLAVIRIRKQRSLSMGSAALSSPWRPRKPLTEVFANSVAIAEAPEPTVKSPKEDQPALSTVIPRKVTAPKPASTRKTSTARKFSTVLKASKVTPGPAPVVVPPPPSLTPALPSPQKPASGVQAVARDEHDWVPFSKVPKQTSDADADKTEKNEATSAFLYNRMLDNEILRRNLILREIIRLIQDVLEAYIFGQVAGARMGPQGGVVRMGSAIINLYSQQIRDVLCRGPLHGATVKMKGADSTTITAPSNPFEYKPLEQPSSSAMIPHIARRLRDGKTVLDSYRPGVKRPRSPSPDGRKRCRTASSSSSVAIAPQQPSPEDYVTGLLVRCSLEPQPQPLPTPEEVYRSGLQNRRVPFPSLNGTTGRITNLEPLRTVMNRRHIVNDAIHLVSVSDVVTTIFFARDILKNPPPFSTDRMFSFIIGRKEELEILEKVLMFTFNIGGATGKGFEGVDLTCWENKRPGGFNELCRKVQEEVVGMFGGTSRGVQTRVNAGNPNGGYKRYYREGSVMSCSDIGEYY